MAVKVKSYSPNGIGQPEWVENGFINNEVTFDNMTFHYGPNQTRNFADNGVAVGFTGGSIVQDTIPFGDARS